MTSKYASDRRWRLAVDEARLIENFSQSGVNEFYGDFFNSNGFPLGYSVSTSVQSTAPLGDFDVPKEQLGIAKRRQRGICNV